MNRKRPKMHENARNVRNVRKRQKSPIFFQAGDARRQFFAGVRGAAAPRPPPRTPLKIGAACPSLENFRAFSRFSDVSTFSGVFERFLAFFERLLVFWNVARRPGIQLLWYTTSTGPYYTLNSNLVVPRTKRRPKASLCTVC